MRKLQTVFLIFILLSCKEDKRTFVELDFKIDSFDWMEDPYKFSTIIRDSIVPEKGNQYASWDFSCIGDIESMLRTWDADAIPREELTQQEKDTFAQHKQHDAIPFILEKAKSHQVVIVNEGHQMPQHRVFTTRLLKGLQLQGFKHLGLESYFGSPKTDSLLNALGYPTLKTGFYTKEPQFGNLVREAHQSGYKLFGYESRGHANGKEREINQAKNIETYLQEHPGEKILIHCGFDHGYEGELEGKWEKAMAGRLTEFTGIDPLTINQVLYSEKSKRELEDPYYQLTEVIRPSVFLNKDGDSFGKYRSGGSFDIAVFHPRSGGSDRPDWMVFGDRKAVAFSFEEAEIACPCLVFAYKEGEEVGLGVPYDVQETSDKKVNLVLDQSNYNLVIWNEKGKALGTILELER